MNYQRIYQGGSSPACDRCDAPQGRLVTLDSRETVCGACIEQMGNLVAVAKRISRDLTPPIECGFLH